MFGLIGTSTTERYQPGTDEIAFRKSDMELSAVQPATLQITCHSEPVLKLVWESPSSL